MDRLKTATLILWQHSTTNDTRLFLFLSIPNIQLYYTLLYRNQLVLYTAMRVSLAKKKSFSHPLRVCSAPQMLHIPVPPPFFFCSSFICCCRVCYKLSLNTERFNWSRENSSWKKIAEDRWLNIWQHNYIINSKAQYMKVIRNYNIYFIQIQLIFIFHILITQFIP